MNEYIKHDLKSFYITCSFEHHNDLKNSLLEKISEQEPDSFTNINSEQTNFINKLDWKLSGDYTREWVKIIKPKLDKILSDIAISNNYSKSDINQIWFQQYGAGNIHGWHTHGLDNAPEFKYEGFPVIVVHKDGKDLKDTKTCYFDSEYNAQKYIKRNNFKNKDYKMYVKENV
jgi:hypothetical protein